MFGSRADYYKFMKPFHPRMADLAAFLAVIMQRDLVAPIRGQQTLGAHFNAARVKRVNDARLENRQELQSKNAADTKTDTKGVKKS